MSALLAAAALLAGPGAPSHASVAKLAATATFSLIVAGMALGYRLLRRRVQEAAADAELDAEFARLEAAALRDGERAPSSITEAGES